MSKEVADELPRPLSFFAPVLRMENFMWRLGIFWSLIVCVVEMGKRLQIMLSCVLKFIVETTFGLLLD